MRQATRITAMLLGMFAGLGGPEHGYFELLQGNIKPSGLMISAIGLPCQPDLVWNRCEPAMTILPTFWWAGLASIIIGVITMIWAAVFIHRKNGPLGMILLCIALLLAGGGLFPPLIGIITSIFASRIHAPLSGNASPLIRLLAKLWPWILSAFFVWVFGQFLIGYYFNDWLQRMSFLVPLLVISLLALSMLCAIARDKVNADLVNGESK